MLKIIRTDSNDIDFIALVHLLDQELQIRDGEDHSFYSQFNKIDHIKYAVVAYDGDVPAGCGAIKMYDNETMEVKRMFVRDNLRGNGIAGKILKELESWAVELGYCKTILETGVKQPEAIRLYSKNMYVFIENYGQYAGMESSVCMKKILPFNIG